MTIMNMAITYIDGLEDYVKAEAMYRLDLDVMRVHLGRRGH